MRRAGLIWATISAALLVGDAAALAQSTTFGGGRLPTVERSRTYRPTVGVTLQTRGERLALRFDTSLLCGRDTFEVSGRRVVAWDGSSFEAQGASVVRLPRGRLEFAWAIRGSVSGQAGDGILRIVGIHRRPNRGSRSCTRRPVRAFQTRAQHTPTGSGSGPEAGGAYLGVSDSRIVDRLPGPVFVRVTGDGRRIGARWQVSARCRPRGRDVFTNFTPATRVRADGSFYKSERFTQRFIDAVVRYRARFSGRFTTDGAYGTLQLRSRIYDRRGKRLLARCDSGRRGWSAMRASLVPPSPPPSSPPASPSSPASSPSPPPSSPPEPSRPAPGPWTLQMTSDEGDYIGQGQTWSHGPPGDQITVEATRGHIRFSMSLADGGWWHGDFAAPQGQALEVRTYENAHRYPFQEPGEPGLDVTGNGRGCNQSTSTFTVERLEWDAGGGLRAFRVRFEQHCEHAQPALRGVWDFQAA